MVPSEETNYLQVPIITLLSPPQVFSIHIPQFFASVYVCIDLELCRELCSVPAWLINGVFTPIGRNEGTERRRPALLDPDMLFGTVSHTHTHKRTCAISQHTFSLAMLCNSVTDVLVTRTWLSGLLSCILPLFLDLFFFLYIYFQSYLISALISDEEVRACLLLSSITHKKHEQ